jgi:enoyl-CoA hydratase/carnithine racemase
MAEKLQSHWDGRVRPLNFEEYSEKYKDFFVMKRENGIIEVRMCTNGGPYQHSWGGHDAWAAAWVDVGNDPDNEVMILTGTGDKWYSIPVSRNPDKAKAKGDWSHLPFREWDVDGNMRQYKTTYKLLENLVFQLDIPTIAAINGPGPHTEFALACDLTLCAPDVDLFDPHFIFGVAPGDGMYLVMQELMGLKNAAYYMYTGEPINGEKAKELGLVNEVLTREKLLPRAWELATEMMKRPRGARYMTSQIAKRPWKKRLVSDLEHHVAHQHYDMIAERTTGTAELRALMPKRVPMVFEED